VDEKDIAARLQGNIPKPAEPTAPEPPKPATDEQSSMVQNAVSELTLLKLGTELGVVYHDTRATEQLKFIHEQMVGVSADTSYESILETVKDYLTRLGLRFNEERLGKLYMWLKLNQERMAIEREMAAQVG